MPETLGDAVLELSTDSSKLDAGIDSAETKAGGLQSKFVAIGTAIAGAFAVGAIANWVQGAIDMADNLNDMAQKTGASVEALSGLSFAAKQSGTNIEALGGGMAKLARNMVEAKSGTGDAAGAFNSLGISLTNADGSLKATDQVLLEVAGKFQGMEDGANKTATAMAIFGKSGADLIPFLNQGSTGLAEMQAEAARLGVTISTETAQAADQFNDNMERLSSMAKGAAIGIAAELLPTLNALGDTFIRIFGGEGQGLATGFGGALAKVIQFLTKAFFDFSKFLNTVIADAIKVSFAAVTGLDKVTGGMIPGLRDLARVGAELSQKFKDSAANAQFMKDEMEKSFASAGKLETQAKKTGKALEVDFGGGAKKAKDAAKDAQRQYELMMDELDAREKSIKSVGKAMEEMLEPLRGDLIKEAKANFSDLVTSISLEAQSKLPSAMNDLALAMAVAKNAAKGAMDDILASDEQFAKDWEENRKEMVDVWGDMTEAWGDEWNSFVTDFLTGDAGLSDMLDMFKQWGKDVIDSLVQTFFDPLKDWLLNKVAGWLTSTFSGFPGFGGRGIGGRAGGGAGGAGGGAAPPVGIDPISAAIIGGLSALGGIIGAAMTKGKLKDIEENTRFTWINLQIIIEHAFFDLQEVMNKIHAALVGTGGLLGELQFIANDGIEKIKTAVEDHLPVLKSIDTGVKAISVSIGTLKQDIAISASATAAEVKAAISSAAGSIVSEVIESISTNQGGSRTGMNRALASRRV